MFRSLEYLGPIVMFILIVILKISVDGNVTVEKIKHAIVEAPVDLMSLSISFVISYLITTVNKYSSDILNEEFMNDLFTGFICFIIYIILTVISVIIAKYAIRMYTTKEQNKYVFIGIILGYSMSVPCVYCSVQLLRLVGGV